MNYTAHLFTLILPCTIQYRNHEGLGILAPKCWLNIYFVTVLVRHSQAQKCLQIYHKPFHHDNWDFKIFLFNRLLTDWLTDLLLTNAFGQAQFNNSNSYKLDFFTVQHCLVPRCAFSPTTAAPMLASLFYQSSPLFSFVLYSSFHYCIGDDLQYVRYVFNVRLR